MTLKSVVRALALVFTLTATISAIAACGSGDGNGTTGKAVTGSSPSANDALPTFSDPTTIDNPYYPLTQYRRCQLRGEENSDRIDITRTLLERTEPFEVGGSTVEAVVVEDRELENGELVERVLDYFAQGDDGTVYLLGKDVDNYEGGRVANHEGRFRYGRETDTLGVVMPADPQIGDRWQQEFVPGTTNRRNRLEDQLPMVDVQGQAYEDVIRVRELELPDREAEFKLYARGAGLVRELPPGGRVELIRCA